MSAHHTSVVGSISLACAIAATPGCQYAPPDELRRTETHTVAAPPDAVFDAARSYYAAHGYTINVLDTDARLLGAYISASSLADAFSDPNPGPYRLEVVWVRPAGERSSNVRIRATWALEYLEKERPAALAAEFEAIALGKKRADQPPAKELPR